MPKILILDDDDSLRLIYARYLKAEGYQVLEAPTVDAALQMAGEKPDVLLLDLQMPLSEGQGLIPVLRQAHPDAKFVIFSCFDLHFQKKTAQNADDYFNKSDGCRALAAKLKTVLTA